MSVIRKKPYVETLLGLLKKEQLTALLTELNTGDGKDGFYSFYDKSHLLPAIDATHDHIKAIVFQFDANTIRNGIVVRFVKNNVSHEALLVYGSSQKITIYELDSVNFKYKLIEELCEIAELRRIVGDVLADTKEVVITPQMITAVMEGSSDVIVDINEQGTKVEVRLDQDVKDLLFYKEVALADIEHDVGESDTLITLNKTNFDADSHYHIIFEIEGTGTHYGAGFDVIPYNTVECFVEGILDVNGTEKKYIATMDSDGQVNITLVGVVMTPESQTTKAYFKKLF